MGDPFCSEPSHSIPTKTLVEIYKDVVQSTDIKEEPPIMTPHKQTDAERSRIIDAHLEEPPEKREEENNEYDEVQAKEDYEEHFGKL